MASCPALPVPDHGAEFGYGDSEVTSVDDPVVATQVSAEKSNAMTRFGRVQRHLHFIPRVNPDTGERDCY